MGTTQRYSLKTDFPESYIQVTIVFIALTFLILISDSFDKYFTIFKSYRSQLIQGVRWV